MTFDRLDTDGCMSTNDTVLLLASGAAGVSPDSGEFTSDAHRGLRGPGPPAAARRRGRSQGRSPIEVVGAASEADAVTVGRSRGPEQPAQVRASPGRTRTGAGCCPRSAPPTRSSSRTGSTSRSTGSGSAGTAARATTGPRSTCSRKDVTITVDLSAGPHAAIILHHRPDRGLRARELGVLDMTIVMTRDGKGRRRAGRGGHRQGGHADRGAALAGPVPRRRPS